MIYLRKLNLNRDIGFKYKKWMNDPEVHKYSEQKYKKHTLKDIKDFVIQKNKSKNEFLYGIFLKKTKSHIGNIKIGPINFIHKFASITFFIGEKELWNKGYSSKSVKEIIKIARKKKIKKLNTVTYAMNAASQKVLEKCGFIKEGVSKSALIYKNKRCDLYLYGKLV